MNGAASHKVLQSVNNCATLDAVHTDILRRWRDAAEARFKTVRFPDGKMAFRFDAEGGIIELQKNGRRHYFHLAELGE